MKTTLFILAMLTGLSRPVYAQIVTETPKSYRVWVKPMTRSRTITGFLAETRDSSLLISRTPPVVGQSPVTDPAIEVWTTNIRQVELRKRGANGMGVLIGASAGAVAGLLIGLAAEKPGADDNLNRSFSEGAMIFSTLLCAGIGAGIGGTVGGIKIKIPIRGSQAELDRHRLKLESCSYHPPWMFPDSVVAGISSLKDTLTDADGNIYLLLTTGDQIWMAENLKVKMFRDNTPIPVEWMRPLSVGNSYDWRAVSDSRKICPAGWHVPEQAEWSSLWYSLGGERNAAKVLDGNFTPRGYIAQWWSSSDHGEDAGGFFVDGHAGRSGYQVVPKTSFRQLRCLRDK